MLTKYERRVLYILQKHGGHVKHFQVCHAMSRATSRNRDQAIRNCESLGLISSAKTPTPKGQRGAGGLVYWLTSDGIDYVQGLIDSQKMLNPDDEPRAGKNRASA